MSSSDDSGGLCEDKSCPDSNQRSFFCHQCDCSFCDLCWDKQPAHGPKKRGLHEKIDRLVVERYRNILESSSSIQDQHVLHKEDEDTTWFGIGRNGADDPIFEDYGRYAALMAESLPVTPMVRYPQLVSFVGQTGAGKSTVVKMLINHQDTNNNPAAIARHPSPVVGSVNDNIPVSANVHLYADPQTISTTEPGLYADCEGLEGGEGVPKAEASRMQDVASEFNSSRGLLSESSSRLRGAINKRGHRAARKLSWAMNDKEKSKREYAVTELYPRVLYTFSDVVVFVLRNPKVFESAVLTKLIGWASASLEKSLGQPTLPHVIIVLNATDLAIDPSQWDISKATQKLLSDIEASIERIPALQAQLGKWRAKGHLIQTTKDFLECYYSSISVVRIPAKGRYMLMDEQVRKLYTLISVKCKQSQAEKSTVRMLSNSEDLQLYLQLAFDHFSRHLDEPFNFVEVALKINPIPSDFSGNIVKLAVAVRDYRPSWSIEQIFDALTLMVASCIMLDIHRNRRLGAPRKLFENYYMDYCEQASDNFCSRHWPCQFQSCVNVKSGHAKGHQDATGKILTKGDYIPSPSFHYKTLESYWTVRLGETVSSIQKSRGQSLDIEKMIPTMHLENMRKFYKDIGPTSNFISHYTCFCCLRESPVHPLTCGHVLCSPCVRFYGVPKDAGSSEMSECPICPAQSVLIPPCLIGFKPPLAGLRILCLDGGGIRGIVELEVLKAIEAELPLNIPITNFFDLIVGTSTGGIIALGLGVEGCSVDECIGHFEKLCSHAFTPRAFKDIWGLNRLSAINLKYSKYKTKPFERILQEAVFSHSDQPLFGGRQNHHRPSVRVALTATSETGERAILLTNYNRSHKKDDQRIYRFERAEKPEQELRVWEAARSTSAAPSYFKPFRSKRNSRGYLDGALYHNNPVRVADIERRLIWPDSESFHPDILLSIGTSYNGVNRADRDFSHSHRQELGHEAEASQHDTSTNRRIITPSIINILKSRVENILDAERTWLSFMSDAARGDGEFKTRYRRINPNIEEDPPQLDEVKKLPHLKKRMQQIVKYEEFQNQTKEIARQLVASLFYVEVLHLPTKLQDLAQIQCKFPSASLEIRRLGEYFKNATTRHFRPCFIIGEKNSAAEPLKIIITELLIQKMIMNASFEVEIIKILVPNESAITKITLSLSDGEEFCISGFPRALLSQEAPSLSPEKHKKQIKPDRVSRHQSFEGDDTDESLERAFPELQRLPENAKMPIRKFLQERISTFRRPQDVPRKLKLLAEATEKLKDAEKNIEDGDIEVEGRGPYGTILHTASAVGNLFLVEVQIEAGEDVTALNNHSWTALMVAKALEHEACARILSKHMETIGVNPTSQALSPSRMVNTNPKEPIHFGLDNLVATPELSDATGGQKLRYRIRANHPVPVESPTFYYEMTVLKVGHLSIGGIGSIRFGASSSWSAGKEYWSYHEGGFFISRSNYSRRPSLSTERYRKGDTIGCGIHIQSGNLFFTRNGENLGVIYSNVNGVLFPDILLADGVEVRVNFGASKFVYDIGAHDWSADETAASKKSSDSIPTMKGLGEL